MNDFEPIKSRDNRRLVELRRVRDGQDRTRIFIEGKRLAEEALKSTIAIEECFFDSERVDFPFLERLRNNNVTSRAVAPKIFPSISDTVSSQGIILTARRPQWSLADIDGSNMPVVFLSEINNPSNLGAIFRTAEAAGVSGVIVSKNSADVFSPKAIRASMGSVFRLKVIESASLKGAVEWAHGAGISSIALDVKGTQSYSELDWSKRRLLVFGSEAHGISTDELALLDETATIPMENGVESLNLAVSTGIVLFEAKRHIS